MIKLKTPAEIKILREGGKILAEILQQLGNLVEPGINTAELEQKAIELIKKAGGVSAFKGYRQSKNSQPFPTALCTSINEEIVHTPAKPGRFLEQGDIISLDIGMKYKNLFTDTAITVPVGDVEADTAKLIKTTEQCLELAIKQVKPGNTLYDIARAIQINAEANGFGVVRELVGHGVGYAVHEEPQVPNYDAEEEDLSDIKLEPGLVIAIEPMVTKGDWQVTTGKNGFSFVTKDKSLAAHFEHTVAVVEDGCLVITES
ncbi:MAG: type I methionyl aminopeptidase [Candidatus Falkowbacteria bacterium]